MNRRGFHEALGAVGEIQVAASAGLSNVKMSGYGNL